LKLPSPTAADITYALARARQERPVANAQQTVDQAWQILSWQYDAAAIDEAAIERQLQQKGLSK
jgi:hypothetical protein